MAANAKEIRTIFDKNSIKTETHLDIDWIEGSLKATFDAESETKLVDFSAELIGIDQGYNSHIYRLHLVWQASADSSEEDTKSSLPRSLVAKIPTPKLSEVMEKIEKDGLIGLKDDAKARILNEWLLVAHLREIEVLKLFTELDRNIAIPRYYGSREFRPQQIGHGCILMEDMQNSSPPPMSEGLNQDQLYQLIENLAKIHAITLNLDLKERWCVRESNPEKTAALYKPWSQMGDGLLTKLHLKYPDLGFDKFSENTKFVWDHDFWMDCICYAQNRNLPQSLTHGDLWTNNMLFEMIPLDDDDANDGKKNKNEEGVGKLRAIVDWQGVRPGFVVDDICRVMASSVDGVLRRQLTDKILDFYYKKLNAELASLGKECPFASVEVIKTAYKYMFPFCTAFTLLGVMIFLENDCFEDTAKAQRAKMVLEDAIKYKNGTL